MRTQSATSFKSFWSRFTGVTIITVLLLIALPAATVFAADTGFFKPSFATTNGKTAWTNPTYSFDSDNLYASTGGKSKQLKLSGFAITPIQGNSQINGIEITVEGYTDGRQAKVELSGDGGATWVGAKQTALSGTESIQTLGGPTDKWGGTWSASNFTNAAFQVKVTSANTNNGILYIDQVRAKIYFTPPNTTLSVPPVSVSYGTDTITLSATLTETIGGAPISGQTVDFTLNGVTAGNAVTDSSGVASVSDISVAGLASGTYPDAIVASFAGGGVYQATSGIADLTIVGIPLTVTADPQTKHYGYEDPVLTYQVVGDQTGAVWTGGLLRDPGEALGDYYINQGTLSAGPGHTITYIGDFLTIDQAPLTVTADSFVKLDTDPDITDFTFVYSGFVLGEDASVLTTAPTCGVAPETDQSVPGSYPITCSGGVADNYSFVYVDGTLTVNAANNVATDITLTPSSVDENHLAGFTVGTLANNDPDPDTFTYTFCGGIDDGSFTIDGATLKTNAVFDFETKNSYGICIQVDDGNGGIFQKNLIVTVKDLPETFYSVGTLDGWVLESTEFSNKGGSRNIKSGIFRLGDDVYDRQYRSILSFNTEPLPDGATITKITLMIKRQGIAGTNPFLTHGNILVDIRNGYFGSKPVLQLADFQAAASLKAAGVIRRTPMTGNWYYTSLNATAYPFLKQTGTTELRLRFKRGDNDDLSADFLKFYSGNALTAAYRPKLVIQYTLP